MISRQIKIAQTQFPDKFGTGNADDVMDALYGVSNYQCWGDKNAYLEYLIDYCCGYVVYRVDGEFGDVLRIDLSKYPSWDDIEHLNLENIDYRQYKHKKSPRTIKAILKWL